MDPILVLSPHMDDAVLSVGQFLRSWPGAYVLTVFAGVPDPAQVRTFDVHSGFSNSTEAVSSRWDEDDRALAAVGAVPIRANLLDGQYQPDRSEGLRNVIRVVSDCVAALHPLRVICPLGIAHPDHQLVAWACAIAAENLGFELWGYEELPNRVLLPEEVPMALDRWRGWGYAPQLGFLGVGDVAAKRRAIASYNSQLWALDESCLYVPERVWKLCPIVD